MTKNNHNNKTSANHPYIFARKKWNKSTAFVLRDSLEGNKLIALLDDRQLNAIIKPDVTSTRLYENLYYSFHEYTFSKKMYSAGIKCIRPV